MEDVQLAVFPEGRDRRVELLGIVLSAVIILYSIVYCTSDDPDDSNGCRVAKPPLVLSAGNLLGNVVGSTNLSTQHKSLIL